MRSPSTADAKLLADIKADLDMRAEDGVVNMSNGVWMRLCEAVKGESSPRYVSSEELAALRKDRESLNSMATLLANARRESFEGWYELARRRGWHLPEGSPLPGHSWVHYWRGCLEHERNPDSGRPVVPHRSGGGDVPPTISHGGAPK